MWRSTLATDGELVDAAKLGILAASLIVGVVGYSILRGDEHKIKLENSNLNQYEGCGRHPGL